MAPRYDMKEIINRSEMAWSAKKNRLSILDQAYSYALPGANPYKASTGDPFDQSSQYQDYEEYFPYDGTLVAANTYLQGRLVVDFFPPNVRWATVQPAPSVDVKGQPTLTEKELQKAEMLGFKYLHDSNFDWIIGSVIQDFTTAGVCFIGQHHNENEDRFEYTPISQAHMAVDIDQHGEPSAFYQRAVYAYDDIIDEYGESAVAGIRKPDTEANRKTFKIVRACMYDPRTKQWEYHVILKEGDNLSAPRHVQDVMLYKKDECPFIMGVWMRAPNEVYGRGPVMIALYEYLKLNYLTEKILHATEYATEGLFTITGASALSSRDVNLSPGSLIRLQSGDDLKRIDAPTTLPSAQLEVEKIQQNVRNIMLWDIARNINRDGNPPTATEVSIHQEQSLRNMGMAASQLSRIGIKLLQFIFAKVESAHGLGRIDNSQITLNSPLVSHQDMKDAMTHTEFYGALRQLQIDPSVVAAKVDEPGFIDKLAKLMNVDLDLIRDEEDMEKTVRQMAQLQQEFGGTATQ